MADNLENNNKVLNAQKDKNKTEILATDILRDAKEQINALISILKVAIISIIVFGIASYIAISYNNNKFLSYLEQYDFTATIEQTGLYTFSDSDGNVISCDIEPEQMQEILEVINGKNKSD